MKSSKQTKNLKYAISAGYYANDEGEVISSLGRTLKPWRGTRGYLLFQVNCKSEGVSGSIQVHRLVAYQKFGDVIFEEGVQVRHLDNDQLNNRFDNIGIGTPSQNAMDRPAEELLAFARNAAMAQRKLSDAEVQELLAERARGATYTRLMKKYKLAKSTVSYIVCGKTYKKRPGTPTAEGTDSNSV